MTHEPDRVDMIPDSKIHGANMGPTWVLSAPVGPHVGTINLAIRTAPTSNVIRLIQGIGKITISQVNCVLIDWGNGLEHSRCQLIASINADEKHNTVWCRYNAVIFPPNFRKRHILARPFVRARYDVSFVDSISDLYSAPVTAVIYVISCYIRPRYNGTQLYMYSIQKQNNKNNWLAPQRSHRTTPNIILLVTYLIHMWPWPNDHCTDSGPFY